MYYIAIFFLWTFVIYWMHRFAHIIPVMTTFHYDHHKYVTTNTVNWHWSNLLLYNDTFASTVDLWLTEVIPTIIMSLIFGWWLFVVYYLWAAFVQERIEHNENFNWYPFTSGKWHMIHHTDKKYNYGICFPIWDILFKTSKPINDNQK
jgi:sterol desaturase/sphingolipid hydroxylase (fatty acid hydroxylase superfamily)